MSSLGYNFSLLQNENLAWASHLQQLSFVYHQFFPSKFRLGQIKFRVWSGSAGRFSAAMFMYLEIFACVYVMYLTTSACVCVHALDNICLCLC